MHLEHPEHDWLTITIHYVLPTDTLTGFFGCIGENFGGGM